MRRAAPALNFKSSFFRYGINITALPAEVEEADDSVVLSSVPSTGSKLWREEGNTVHRDWLFFIRVKIPYSY